MFHNYFNKIQSLTNYRDDSSEHTFRAALENMLNSFIAENINRRLIVKHEPLKQGGLGRPDYKVITDEFLTIGLIETKKLGADLLKLLDSEQIERYRQISDNLILTNYSRFLLLKNGELIFDVTIFEDSDLQNTKFKIASDKIYKLSDLLSTFFNSEPETIFKAELLAIKLSDKSRFLKEFCAHELTTGDDKNNKLFAVFNAFRDTLLPTLEPYYFSDIYAQTLTYGLFLSALNTDEPKKLLNKITAYSFLPNTFPLIRELFHNLDDFPKDLVWSIDEIITILKATDFTAIRIEFAEYRKKGKGFSDPFIYFYEDFLYHYDATQRKIRGVYYTPEPVVSFIVRSIESILKDEFELADGYINDSVTLLDFATGTGTFILNAFEQAINEAERFADKSTVNRILNEKIIKNFYGFELLVAPYIIANLKISEFLKEKGYTIDNDKRLNIYLTNTLNNQEPKPFPFLPHLTEEGRMANKIKNQDILVVMGNPPYSVSSSNRSGFIADEKMGRYKKSISGEQNIQPLSDDYVKFIRFAHWKMEKAEKGVIGIITNNSFIDGVIHRGIREELLNDFDEIYILNLHGSSRKSISGKDDENVFAIMQGVAISIFVKKNISKPKECKVYYAELTGKKDYKLDFLLNNDYKSLFKKNNPVHWTKVKAKKDYYFFSDFNDSHRKKYEKGIKITDIFDVYSSGVKTHRDHFLIDFDKNKLARRISEFYNLDETTISQKFNLKNTRDWKIKNALQLGSFSESFIKRYSYRPFDLRYIYYDTNLFDRGTSRFKIFDNPIENNIFLTFSRKADYSKTWKAVSVSKNIIDIHFSSDQTYFAPLFINNELAETSSNPNTVSEPMVFYGIPQITKKPNFTKSFLKFFDRKYKQMFTPEDILGYIYAILHSPAYRDKYVDFLRIDFPKIIFTDDENTFKKLADLGNKLIEHQLMKKSYGKVIAKIEGIGSNYKVETVRYEAGKVYFNKQRYFSNIPERIWNFYIGGYQVLDKWLKERKKAGTELSTDDILHFLKIINVIDETINIMDAINEETKDWI